MAGMMRTNYWDDEKFTLYNYITEVLFFILYLSAEKNLYRSTNTQSYQRRLSKLLSKRRFEAKELYKLLLFSEFKDIRIRNSKVPDHNEANRGPKHTLCLIKTSLKMSCTWVFAHRLEDNPVKQKNHRNT